MLIKTLRYFIPHCLYNNGVKSPRRAVIFRYKSVYSFTMITKEEYIILDKLPINNHVSGKLCIINFNIKSYIDKIHCLIESNPDTIFWVATKDFSKDYIKEVSKLGIKNVISTPINIELINDFFNDNKSDVEDKNTKFIPLKNSRIVIVDDNEFNVSLLTDILSDIGIKINACLHPSECLKIAQNERIDLFLLDILMPEMSGFELAEKIKTTELNAHTPIIFISAISGKENILNGYNIGAFSYIEKPFHPSIIKAQIYNLLKTNEDLKEEEKTKEGFVASLTHDLKSPINAEINALKYLLDKTPNPQEQTQNEMLSELLNSAKYMKLITDKILCHYKQKNNQIRLSKEKVSLRELIVECIEEIKYLTGDKNIKIRLYSDVSESYANVDIIEIKRVINNLLSNAIEYSNQNSYVDVILSKTETYYLCEIKDYGKGIDLKNYSCIFDEYVTFSKEHKKVGFGLGLNICKSIIEAHNGTITINSTPNKGTSIVFSIPL